MFSWGIFFFDRFFVKLKSLFIKRILIYRGVSVGDNFLIYGIPYLKLNGKTKNIIIGNNVEIYGNIDIRNREYGKIIISDNVKFDTDCRLVAANNAILTIGECVAIGPRCIFNCGANVTIGKKSLFSGGIFVNSSAHEISRNTFIRDQGYYHKPVVIGEDVFIGANAVISPGVHLKNGSVIGANAVASRDCMEYSINVGIPAKIIKTRE